MWFVSPGCADRFPGTALVGYVKLLNGELKKAENVLKVVAGALADRRGWLPGPNQPMGGREGARDGVAAILRDGSDYGGGALLSAGAVADRRGLL